MQKYFFFNESNYLSLLFYLNANSIVLLMISDYQLSERKELMGNPSQNKSPST
jgi:hypothetical protein